MGAAAVRATVVEAKATLPPPPLLRSAHAVGKTLTGSVFRQEVAIAQGRANDLAAVNANAALVELQHAERALRTLETRLKREVAQGEVGKGHQGKAEFVG